MQRRRRRALRYSFAVEPLRLPPYHGEVSGELPLYSDQLREHAQTPLQRLRPAGRGRTFVNKTLAYDVLYTAIVEGREMYGRDVLLLPERPGAREGVAIVMLTAPGASRQVEGPIEVATAGVLLRPLKSFRLG